MRKFTSLILCCALVGFIASCGGASMPTPPEVPGASMPALEMPKLKIMETAIADGSFKTLVTAIQAADLSSTLQGDGPFTVFAPTDAAFKNLPAGALDGLLANKDDLAGILRYHVIPGKKIMAADITDGAKANTAQGSKELFFKIEGETVKVNGVTVTKADIECSNGVIHVVDSVIIPAGVKFGDGPSAN